MRTLGEITLSIPPMWKREQEWMDALEEVEPLERPMVRLQFELSRLLRETEDVEPTPGVLAWLILWTRVFQGLEGLRGALVRRSILTCHVLERTVYEVVLHCAVVLKPLNESDLGFPWKTRLEVCCGRLGAYLAWCLWNDLSQWEHFLHPTNLRRVYEPRSTREYVREYGRFLEEAESVLGEVPETLTDAEAEQEREEAERAGRARVELLKRWLSDDRIAEWANQVQSRRPNSFFELLKEDETSALRALKSLGMSTGYAIYKRGSSAIHGSSMEQVLFTALPALGPAIWAPDEDIAEAVEQVLRWARSSFHALWLLRPSAFEGASVGLDGG